MNSPPAMDSARRATGGSSPAWAFAGLFLLLVFARLSVAWQFPLPFCGLKWLTGVPCPFCGGARCFQACSCFAFADALRWNPLVFLVCLATALWFALWAADGLLNRRWQAKLRPWLATRALRPLFIGAVVLNWIYLCLTLP